ncbi:hypothetical protein L6164_001385 [Bauhinia variegata]|uniref:Uncharacterized protein n=1 Tax=Bauhinia variegata TaxID=167791 RepID=A0ACB9QBL5_BAUVA|nr:hypothetical protein L6164_001385 [Bauhinia variegata]
MNPTISTLITTLPSSTSDGARKCSPLSQGKNFFGHWRNRLYSKRVQPEVKRLYILLRAPNSFLATKRLHNEVIRKDLFRVLRDKWGADFGCFISEKLIAVAGDISVEKLGIKEEILKQEMSEEIDIVVHTAATTNFNERFDISMRTNTMGAFHVMNFTKSCQKIQILLHLSTGR